jgi:hypothetical protein
VAVPAVEPALREQMWRLFERYYSDVDAQTFARDLATKDHVVVVRDAADGSLQGFSTLQRIHARVGGRRVSAVFSGDTIMDRRHWHTGELTRAIGGYLARTWLADPLGTTCWFLVSKGYLTYLLLPRNFPEFYPRRDHPTPPWAEELVARLARERFGSFFRPDRGVVVFDTPHGRLEEGVAPIGQAELAQPDIAFFAQANPGHASGDELCCVGIVDARMLLFQARKRLRKALRGRAPSRSAACPESSSSSSISPGSPG